MHRNGQTVWLVTSGLPLLDEKGNLLGYRGVDTDITERKRAEKELRASKDLLENVLNTLPVGVWIMDANGKMIKGNPAGLQVWAGAKYVGPEQFGEYKGWWLSTGKLIAPEEWAAAGRSGAVKRRSTRKSRSSASTGCTRSSSIRRFPCATSGGSTGGIIINNDISDLKRSEEALAQSLEQLRQSQKMEAVGRLAGGIAHDFNNLLTVITGYCELMMIKIEEGNPLLQDLQEISKSADRAAALTRQLLAFSRRQILQPKVLEIDTVVPEMDKMLRRLIGEDIDLVTILGAGAGKVKVDPRQIEQVIVNLVINSRDAMPDGGTITIETANVELDQDFVRLHGGAWPGPHVMLAVSDTGCGMDPETLSKAFDPFFTTKEKGKGTGLGLSTVFGIVKQSGGCLYAYSEPGRGTTMKIYLPRVTGETAPKDERRDAGFDDRLHGSETILLVEDDETLRKLASSILEGYGYTVLSAGNGEEALQLLNDSPGIPRLVAHRRGDAEDGGQGAFGSDQGDPSGHPGPLHVRVHRQCHRSPRRAGPGGVVSAEAVHAEGAGEEGTGGAGREVSEDAVVWKFCGSRLDKGGIFPIKTDKFGELACL